jgi:hypothetical protein
MAVASEGSSSALGAIAALRSCLPPLAMTCFFLVLVLVPVKKRMSSLRGAFRPKACDVAIPLKIDEPTSEAPPA